VPRVRRERASYLVSFRKERPWIRSTAGEQGFDRPRSA